METAADHHEMNHGSMGNDFVELAVLINRENLLDRQYLSYALKTLLCLGALALGIFWLSKGGSLWLQLLNAAFMGFVFVQFGLLGHDASHQGIFKTTHGNDIGAYLGLTLGVGLSKEYWNHHHNLLHHQHPNEDGMDPDMHFSFIAYTEAQTKGVKGLTRLAMKYQTYLILPLLVLYGAVHYLESYEYIIHDAKHYVVEVLLQVLHYALVIGPPLYFLPLRDAILVIVVIKITIGYYSGFIFAPNHKGMLTTDKENKLDYVRTQVLTSRNVTPNWFTDFFYGGLNYQIEHHLFPAMPRNNFRRAREIVMSFCSEKGIAYHQAGIYRSWAEILGSFHELSRLVV